MSEPDIVVTPEAEPAPSLSTLGAQGTREFIRYFLASAIALAIDVTLLMVLTEQLGMDYLLSGALAFTAGLVTIYVLSIAWVFETRTFRSVPVEFLIFAGIGLIGLLINEFILWLMAGVLGTTLILAKGMSVTAVFSWNFLARRALLFKQI